MPLLLLVLLGCFAGTMGKVVDKNCKHDFVNCPQARRWPYSDMSAQLLGDAWQGWQAAANGTCFAPKSYVGHCDRQFDGLANMPDARKKELQAMCVNRPLLEAMAMRYMRFGLGRCNFRWPCNGECQQATCFVKICALAGCKILSGEDVFSHQEIAAKCGLSWPCAPQCDEDFSAECPTVGADPGPVPVHRPM
ncbi:unnamed protein product [Durusdinium trenchii]|uniref:CPW-WPC domain-containing protein n=1 Tax=Durusdinium trenchii TaxID=1381693 RepID=A0ABP0LUB3_9DINO